MSDTLEALFRVVEGRKTEAPEGSYTARLFAMGKNEICKKVGEEGVEVVVAAQGETRERIVYESADLVYHLMVLLAAYDLKWQDVEAELAARFK
jgi:phosphoribosyl-ATP pyrophosphohydrolase